MTYKIYPTATDTILKLDEASPLFKFDTDALWTDKLEDFDGTSYSCTYTITTTTLNKALYTVTTGTVSKVVMISGTGDDTWNDWETFASDRAKSTTKDLGYSYCVSNSSGNKNWIEIHIYDASVTYDTTTHRPVLVFDDTVLGEL